LKSNDLKVTQLFPAEEHHDSEIIYRISSENACIDVKWEDIFDLDILAHIKKLFLIDEELNEINRNLVLKTEEDPIARDHHFTNTIGKNHKEIFKEKKIYSLGSD
jgi:hypothetical protein